MPALNSGRVALLDVPRLVSQIVGLERRTSRGGRDSIDHAQGGHDDLPAEEGSSRRTSEDTCKVSAPSRDPGALLRPIGIRERLRGEP